MTTPSLWEELPQELEDTTTDRFGVRPQYIAVGLVAGALLVGMALLRARRNRA